MQTIERLKPYQSDNLYIKAKIGLKNINNPELRKFMAEGIELAFDVGNMEQLKHAMSVHSYPVHVEEFMFGPRFLRRPRNEIYPVVLDELIGINERNGRLINTLTELVATGGIGSAKTTTALYTCAYQLYLLSCYKNPHVTFQMDSTSEIIFIFQSLNATLAKEVDYARFKAICEQSYYFTTVFPFDKGITSAMNFPNRIQCKPIGADGGAIGQNVIGGLIDEVNFMAVIEKSVKSVGGGAYDQARVIYDGVSRRIKTRFVNSGGMPGVLCLVSSRNYPGEFTDVKLKEAESDPSIYIYDKCVWDVKPSSNFTGERFPVFCGDEIRKPKVLEFVEDVSVEDRALVIMVPVEYRDFFNRDLIGSMRDIAGKSTMARFPYILNSEAIDAAFGKVKSILSKDEHDFSDANKLTYYPSRFRNLDQPRWVHIDLGVTGDAAGVACGYVKGFKATMNKDAFAEEVLPDIDFDFVLRVVPPKGDEILFYKIRELLYKLRDSGLPIRWVTFDTYQSVDSMQLLKQQGFVVGNITTDVTMVPYDFTKNAFYDGRIALPEHRTCKKEFLSLERDQIKRKVDHPPNGSKDCSDAVAGVVHGLTTRREIWGNHGVAMVRIPDSIRVAQQKEQQ
jgi:hypothetical protein